MSELSATGANPNIKGFSPRGLHKNYTKHVKGEANTHTWDCPTCGNVNDNYLPDVCIRCNWSDYNKWDDATFDEATASPDFRGFGWVCPVCENNNVGEFPGYDICVKCSWQDEGLQRDDPDCWGCANYLSLNPARLEYSLLMNEVTRLAALEAQKEHKAIERDISTMYANIDHRTIDGDNRRNEYKAEFERYTAALQAIQEGRG